MTCPACAATNRADARVCQACGAALVRVCPVCGAENPPNARFCNQCGSPLPIVAAAAPEARALAPQPAPAEADGTAAEEDEQRRVVTILFADLTRSTAMAEEMDPEDVRALLGAFFETVAHQIHRHGGTVEKYIGDAVMAVFGLPLAHEDDPLRAVRAALDMQAALRRANAERRTREPGAAELQMRIGINTGDVAASGRVSEGGDFLITGDAVNVAARLQQLASPGAVLVGPRTYRGTHGAVRYDALPAVRLRGKSRPLRVWAAVALAGAATGDMPPTRGVESLHAPLVGRDAELALLRAVAARVTSERRPQLVTVLGVPGIGKTRLVREFLAAHAAARHRHTHAVIAVAQSHAGEAAGTRAAATVGAPAATAVRMDSPRHAPVLLEGRCPPYGEAVTYWPLVEMLRAHCGFAALESRHSARAKLLRCVTQALARAGRAEDPRLVAAYLGHTIGIEAAERHGPPLPDDSQQRQEGILRAWRVFFEALAAPAGAVVLVEDIHWADDALLDLLEDVAAHTSSVPLLLITTARPELLERRPAWSGGWSGGESNHVTIVLEKLAEHDTRRLLDALLPGGRVPQSLRLGILGRAEGNPFFIEEIVYMLVDRGILIAAPAGDGWQVAPEYIGSPETYDPAIPDTVQGVLLARLDLLAPTERDVLQHAAVFGRFFWPSALRMLAPHLAEGDLNALLIALQAKDLIHASEHARSSLAPPDEVVYTFNHALTREITYSTIARTRRAHEHARIAAWLEEVTAGREAEFADLLARHYRQYYIQANLAHARSSARRVVVRATVLRYLQLAGEQAMARHAAMKADRSFSDALAMLDEGDAADNVPLRTRLLVLRGDARWMALRADDAWADYAAALRLWSTGHDATEANVVDGDTFAQGLHLYRVLVQLPTRYPSYFQRLPPHEELRAYLDRGLALARAQGREDSLDYAALLTAKSFFWWSWAEHRGERELLDALASAREAVRITEARGSPRGASEALDALANILATSTDLRGFLENQERRLRWATRIEDPSELADIHAEVSLARTMVGDYATAVEHARIARELALATGSDMLYKQALANAALAEFEWDHWAAALASSEELLTSAPSPVLPLSHHHTWALLALAVANMRIGADDAAERLASQVDESAAHRDTLYIELFRGRLALARGATAATRRLWLDALTCRGGRHSLATLQSELAELAARTGDAALWQRFGAPALELGWRSGARKALAQAIRARAIVALGERRWDDAQADVENALRRYVALGTPWEEARTRCVLAGLSRRRAAPGDDAIADGELTRALKLFQAAHAVRDVASVRAALAGGDVRLP